MRSSFLTPLEYEDGRWAVWLLPKETEGCGTGLSLLFHRTDGGGGERYLRGVTAELAELILGGSAATVVPRLTEELTAAISSANTASPNDACHQ